MCWAAACVDTTPLDYHEPTLDAGTDGSGIDATVRNACRDCVTVEGAPCWRDYMPCITDDRCVAFSDCLFDLGCFSFPQLQDRITCGQPCFQRVGVVTSSDPALQLTLPVNGCTSPGNSCGSACIH
jgi:hypothetical protein